MRARSLRLVAGLVALASGVIAAPAGAQSTGVPDVPDLVESVTIIPPGQDGTMDLLEFAQFTAGDTRPEHYDDQLAMYAGLVDDDDVTAEDLNAHYHSQAFGPDEIVEEYSPREGVTVYRDTLGVPHIYGDTLENTEFALGYVTAQDRLFQADLFRHAALGTLASFVGPSYVEMDRATRLESYTEEELQAMLDDLPKRFPQRGLGQSILDGLEAYTEGMNAYIDEVSLDPTRLPAEYVATGNVTPEPWRAIDTAALGVLQLRVFGETAGAELRNANLYRELTQRLGKTIGAKVFDDLRKRNDAAAYTSIQAEDGRWPSQKLPKVNPKAVAIPDEPPAEDGAAAKDPREIVNEGLARIGFPTLGSLASNALLVHPKRSTTGHALQIGAPQVGYSVPQFFMDIDVHGGTAERRLDFRGGAVPGASLLAAVGRGIDYAWTLTTGVSDAVDVRAELLCEPGGTPTVDSRHYVFKGKCVAMDSRTETISWNMPPTELLDPASAQPPGSEDFEIDRTRHGPVFFRGTVGGKPVAFVRERLFWKRELESFAAFTGWNSSSETRSMADFFRAADRMTVSFNVFYADSKNIGYYHIGEYPVRAGGVDPRLPSWGTGQWEWKGTWPFKKNPHVFNPKQGWLVNWNNKPSASWDSGDDTAWGDVHRVRLLAGNMRERLSANKKIDRADLVDVIRDAATRDMDAYRLLPQLLAPVRATIKSNPADKALLQQVVGILEGWYTAGQHRADQDHDGMDDNGPATAIFDAWFDATVHSVFDDELGDALGLAGVPVSDRPEFNNGSAYFADFGNHLATLLSKRRTARNYCDDMETAARESCATRLVASLRAALGALATAQESEDPSEWTRAADLIRFEAQGGGSVPDIPWQNRGTYNHIAEIMGKRPSA